MMKLVVGSVAGALLTAVGAERPSFNVWAQRRICCRQVEEVQFDPTDDLLNDWPKIRAQLDQSPAGRCTESLKVEELDVHSRQYGRRRSLGEIDRRGDGDDFTRLIDYQPSIAEIASNAQCIVIDMMFFLTRSLQRYRYSVNYLTHFDMRELAMSEKAVVVKLAWGSQSKSSTGLRFSQEGEQDYLVHIPRSATPTSDDTPAHYSPQIFRAHHEHEWSQIGDDEPLRFVRQMLVGDESGFAYNTRMVEVIHKELFLEEGKTLTLCGEGVSIFNTKSTVDFVSELLSFRSAGSQPPRMDIFYGTIVQAMKGSNPDDDDYCAILRLTEERNQVYLFYAKMSDLNKMEGGPNTVAAVSRAGQYALQTTLESGLRYMTYDHTAGLRLCSEKFQNTSTPQGAYVDFFKPEFGIDGAQTFFQEGPTPISDDRKCLTMQVHGMFEEEFVKVPFNKFGGPDDFSVVISWTKGNQVLSAEPLWMVSAPRILRMLNIASDAKVSLKWAFDRIASGSPLPLAYRRGGRSKSRRNNSSRSSRSTSPSAYRE